MDLIGESWILYLTGFLAVAAAFVYHYLTSTHNFWKKLNVPYVEPEILYGNMKDIAWSRKTQNEVFMEFYRNFKNSGHKFGGVFQLRDPVLLVCSADVVRDVLVKNFSHFHDRPMSYDENFDPLSAHLIALEGQRWKFVRSKLNPAFSTGKLKVMFASMVKTANKMIEVLKEVVEKEQMIEMRDFMAKYTVDIIADIAFGIEINALKENSKFLLMGQKYFKPTKWEHLTQIIANTYPWLYKIFKLRFISKEMTKFFTDVIRETMEYRRNNNVERNDFLHFLMKIDETAGTNLKDMEEMKGVINYNMSIDEKSIEFTEGVITAQAYVFFLAGYETSSSTLGSCFFELAHHPDIQERLYQEVSKVFQKHGEISYDCLQELTYVEMVLEETLRIYPPVGFLLRKCTAPYRLYETGPTVPKGVPMFVPIYAIHHDPEYFPEPEKFLPERFSPQNRNLIPPYAFMPFGHGPRVCIGSRLAMMELKLTLAYMIKNFRIFKCEKTKPLRQSPQSFFFIPQDGYWVSLVKREEE